VAGAVANAAPIAVAVRDAVSEIPFSFFKHAQCSKKNPR
jgi:hypothetical protein